MIYLWRFSTIEKYICRKHIKVQAKKAKLKLIRIHDLRHSFALMLVNEEIDIKTIVEQVDLTWNLYNHLYPNAQDEATNYIDSL